MNWKALLLALGLLGIWEACVHVFGIPDYMLPAPSTIALVLWQERERVLLNALPTAYEVWLGFGLAFVAGTTLAIPIALTKFGSQAMMPIVVASQSIPKTALAPLFLVWFGFGMLPKIVIAATIAFFPIVVNLVRGLQAVEPEMVQYMRTLGATPGDIFRRLRLPMSLPFLFAGLKVSISLATVGAVVGEFVGADEGLGYLILRSINNFDTPTMFAGLVAVSLLGVLSYGAILVVEKRFLDWEPEGIEAVSAGA